MLRFLRMGNKRTKTIWWILIIFTVVSFVGGFIVLFGMGLDSTTRARVSGDAGVINGDRIARVEYQNALNDQREQFRRQYGSAPADRDEKSIEAQTWRSLVSQHLLAAEARHSGIRVTDPEVVFGLQTSPPQILAQEPQLMTNGKFDATKYRAALANPSIDWSPFEQMERQQLPVRKLQERLFASLKVTEQELLDAYRDRFEKVNATLVVVGPSTDTNLPTPSDADLQRAYDKYRDRFVSGPGTQLEVLQVQKKYTDEELRAARELAQGLAVRARRGEDFGSLARDYSEGSGADKGGLIDRVVQPAELGPALGPKLAALKVGEVADPYQEGSRFMIFKLVDQPRDSVTGATRGLKLAQIMIKVRPNENTLRQQLADMKKLRERAARIGLGKAAAEKALTTTKTPFFDVNNEPPALMGEPEAAEWGLGAKKDAVSPVFEGVEEFAIAQVVAQRQAGAAPREEIAEPLRQLAEMEARVARNRPKADGISQALAHGRTLEQASAALGLTPLKLEGLTRAQPDGRLASVPEVQGALFAADSGKVIGPIASATGWYFVRIDRKIPADPKQFDQLRASLSTNIMQRRQQNFFTGYVTALRGRAKVQDLRNEGN